MILYIAVALWPILSYWFYTNYSIGFNRFSNRAASFNFYIVLSLLPMFIIIALRNPSMGADTYVYLRNFLYVRETPLKEVLEYTRMETGYIVFVKLIGCVTSSPLIYQIVCVSIYFICFFDFTKNLNSDDVFWFIFFVVTLGFFFFMFTGVRQCLAISICLFSYKFCVRRKFLKFLICVLLASLFHKSAILFVAVYIIFNKKVTIYNVILYGVCVWFASNYLLTIQNFLNEQLDYNYTIEATGNGLIFLLILVLLTIFSMIMAYNNREMDVPYTKALININFITIFFWIIRLQTRVAERPSYYFLLFSCSLFAHGLTSIKDNREKRIFTCLIVIFSMLLFIYRLKTNYASLVPYRLY